MMRYKIRHTTAYQYSEPVPLSQNQLRLTPRNRGGQKLLRRRLRISPKPELITHRRDYFANLVSHFDVYEPHGELVITSHAEVVVDRPVVDVRMLSSSWDSIAHQLKSDITSNGLHRYQFTFPSALAPKLPVAYEYAVRSFQAELVGADASHAWISLFAGSLGWVDFDPTNKLIVQNEHVVLAIGRDYRDVCPVNGLFIGGGKQSLSVSVRLKPEKV